MLYPENHLKTCEQPVVPRTTSTTTTKIVLYTISANTTKIVLRTILTSTTLYILYCFMRSGYSVSVRYFNKISTHSPLIYISTKLKLKQFERENLQ